MKAHRLLLWVQNSREALQGHVLTSHQYLHQNTNSHDIKDRQTQAHLQQGEVISGEKRCTWPFLSTNLA